MTDRLRSVANSLDAERLVGSASDIRQAADEVDALVARITDLEAMVEWDASSAQRAVAAEAQVAALTQERDAWSESHAKKDKELWAADAALATTRQALAFIAAKIEEGDYGAALSRAISASPTPDWDSTT